MRAIIDRFTRIPNGERRPGWFEPAPFTLFSGFPVRHGQTSPSLQRLFSSLMLQYRDSPSSSSAPSYNLSDDTSHEQYPMLTGHETLKNNHQSPIFPDRRKRRYVYLGCIGLVIVSTLAYFAISVPKTTSQLVQEPAVQDSSSRIDLLDPSLYLNGPPTRSFRGIRFQTYTLSLPSQNSRQSTT